MTHWVLILIAASANIALNLCLRKLGRNLDTDSVSAIAGSVLVSPWTWLSVLNAAILLMAFVAAIRLYSLSLTYASVTALAMVGLTIVSVALRIDTVTTPQIIGLSLIVTGILVSAFA